MKKRTWILSMILTIIFAFSANGYSQLIISVSINPFLDPSYSNSSPGGSFYALVTVTNYTNASIQSFQLQNETFLSFNPTNPTNSLLPLPTNWISEVVSPPWGGQKLILRSPENNFTPLAPGASFSFVMNYTFASNISALNAPWSSTGLWSMKGAVLLEQGGITGTQSFSTTPTPEPGTIILLGFGLLGSGFFARRRKKRDS